jgi:hypothetical protein
MLVFISGCSKSTNTAWELSTDKDAFTDKISYYSHFLPKGNKSDARLVFSCSKLEQLTITLVTNQFISKSTFIEYRVDSRTGISRHAVGVDDVIFIYPEDANIFIDELRNGSTLIMRFHSAADNSYNAMFDISDVSAQTETLKKLCEL